MLLASEGPLVTMQGIAPRHRWGHRLHSLWS